MDGFSEFYAVRKDAVLRAVIVATRGQRGAEDAVAEAFARAYARWGTVSRHPNPTAWVIRTALNEQRSWRRRLFREVPTAGSDAVSEDAAHDELGEGIRTLVSALPKRQREVVGLRILADLSAEETASLLGIAPSTVHVHLHRALSTMRAHLSTDRSGVARLAEEGS
jgi:RNA polymerase sigma-70 factor (ECF subfamily)